MSVLDELAFAPMLITDVFESIQASRAWYDKNKIMHGEGAFPYVSRSGASNGHESVIGKQSVSPNTGNAITVGVDTQTVFYQPTPFYTSVKIQVLRHPRLSLANGLVLVTILRQQMSRFKWGNGASLDRLRGMRIMIPVRTDAQGQRVVDWDGMTRLGDELLVTVRRCVVANRETEQTDDDTLPELVCEPMPITDVFESVKSSSAWYDRSKLATTGEGRHPFVSRARSGNGVDGFFPRQEKAPEPGNAITIGLDTQTIGYQPVAFYTSQNIQVLRHPCLNQSNGMVLSSLIEQQMGKFGWGGNGATLGRLRRTRIMVPVTISANGETVVDWDRMTAYGRALRVRAERKLTMVLEPVS